MALQNEGYFKDVQKQTSMNTSSIYDSITLDEVINKACDVIL